MSTVMLDEGLVKGDSVSAILESAMNAGGGLLRLTPTWVPRSFLHPGRRIKLHPNDYYRFGADRGGIDERWFGSTTETANEGRVWHEGLSFCLHEGQKFLLRDAVTEKGSDLVGEKIFSEYQRWPVYSKFFDNMEPIPHHMHTDEVFISYTAATAGVEVENLGTEPLVGLRYFGPDTHSNLPKDGS